MNLNSKSNSSADSSDPLPKKEAIKVFARWVSEFELQGHPKEIQQKVLDRGYVSGEDAKIRILRRKNESFYLIHAFDRKNPEIYSDRFPDLDEIKDSNKDMAIVTEDFKECLVINHEDGEFWNGPIYLKNKSAEQGGGYNGD
jgi:hypothetical protein